MSVSAEKRLPYQMPMSAGKAFARIGLALRRDVGVADDHGRGNPPAVDDIAAKFRQRGNLLSVETALAERAVADLDADGGRIDVGDAAPEGDAGMPGAFVFADALINGAVVINDVMSGKLQFFQLRNPFPGIVSHGVDDQHADRKFAFVKEGKRAVCDHGGPHSLMVDSSIGKSSLTAICPR